MCRTNATQMSWECTVVCHSLGVIHIEHTQEVCRKEEFNPRCNYNEVILVTKASYGHLHLGRCMPRDLGHFGCGADVTSLVDTRCSGKRSCSLQLVDPELESAEPECALGLVTFLEVSHLCIKG